MASNKEPLTGDFLRSILSYDPQTGELRWKERADRAQNWNSRYAGRIAGTVCPDGYIIVMIGKGMNYRAHVVIWAMMTDEWRPNGIDHRHGVRGDNRWNELRAATQSDNSANKRMQSNNASGVPGVWFNNQRRRWEAVISKGGRRVWRGFFKSIEEAANARANALKEHHGEFAVDDPERMRYRHSREHVQ